MLLILHALFASIWLGCVLTEVGFERVLARGTERDWLNMARIHHRVDALIEIPAYVAVLITGVLMWGTTAINATAAHVMIGAGSIAIATNVVCSALVFRRLSFAQAERWEDFHRADAWLHRLGAVVLIGLLMALIAGFSLRFSN